MSEVSVAKKIAQKLTTKAEAGSSNALETLERLLPSGASDAERAALRSDPEKYKQYLDALDEAYGTRGERMESLGANKNLIQSNEAARQYLDNNNLKFQVEDEGGQLAGRVYDKHGNQVGYGAARLQKENPYIDLQAAGLQPMHRGNGIYPYILQNIAVEAEQKRGLKGVQSLGNQRSDMATKSWEKVGANFDDAEKNYYLDADAAKINLRKPEAAFDPRFKDSADILALQGNQAPRIAASMLRPQMNLGDAFGAITEPIEKLDKPVNDAAAWVSDKVAQQTNLVPKSAQSSTTDYAEGVRKEMLNQALGLAAPTPSSVLMGKTLPLFKAAKGATIAERLAAKEAPVLEKTAADQFREARAANKAAQFGTVAVKDTEPKTLGKVTVIDTAPKTLGKVIVKP